MHNGWRQFYWSGSLLRVTDNLFRRSGSTDQHSSWDYCIVQAKEHKQEIALNKRKQWLSL